MELQRGIRLIPGQVIALAIGLLLALVLSMAAGYELRGGQSPSPTAPGRQEVATPAPAAQGPEVSQGERLPTHGQLP